MKYNIIETAIEVEGVKANTYGISGNGTKVEDISLNKAEVEKLLETINDLGDLDPKHLFNVCEDYVERLA